MVKAAKATKRFIKSGQLKKQIEQRHKHKKIKQQIDRRKATRGKPAGNGRDAPSRAKGVGEDVGADDEEEEGEDVEPTKKFKGMSVDDFLGAAFMQEGDEGGTDDEDEESDEDDEEDDDQSFASVDELEGDEDSHRVELDRLKETDPEFYKYLEENDRELLDFGKDEDMTDGDEEEEEEEEADVVDGDEGKREGRRSDEVTKELLRAWQKALLEVRSLRSLRKLLLAFRAAAHMNEDDSGEFAYTIGSASVFNKLVVTALKYTPVVLAHHLPYKSLPDGRFKPPTQNKKHATLQRLILSYFGNVMHLIRQLPDGDMKVLVLSESAKVIPYITSSRKTVKEYLKLLLELWSSATDDVRMTSLLAIRRLACASDQSILDMCLKGVYVSFVRSCKSTTVHTLPSINLMKNSASEIYALDHEAAYQHAFRYIRQLAVHLRESMKVKSKESYKAVYNWQYVHSVDFWSIVLAKACDSEQGPLSGSESALRPLIYPLVQVTIGAIKLIPTPRYFPLHFQCLRSLLHLTRHTGVFIPLSPYILQVLMSAEFSHKPKPSTLRALDLEVYIRVPAPYARTRVYQDALAEECAFLQAEWFATVASSIAFPELSVPVLIALRRCMKKSGSPKLSAVLKPLVERIDDHAKWMEKRRSTVTFGPGDRDKVVDFEGAVKVDDTPLGKWLKVQRKTREKRKALMQKAREGGEEMLEE